VLFADVKGSMELAEHLDPEQWHTILDAQRGKQPKRIPPLA
jgi:class 3 adenylate cyclase